MTTITTSAQGEGVEDTTPPLARTQRAGTRTRTRTRETGGRQPRSVDGARARSLWHAQPASLAVLWDDVRDGEWVPGERPPLIERAGAAYGVAAFALTAVLYAVAWVTQRPGRLTITLAAVAGIWLTR